MTMPKAAHAMRAIVLVLACALAHASASSRGWLVRAKSKEEAHQHTRRAMLEQQEQGHELLAAWWDDWKGFYAKEYATVAEDAQAFAAFQANMRRVHDINADLNLTFWASGNQYSDLTWEQFKEVYLLKNFTTGSSAATNSTGNAAATITADDSAAALGGRKAAPGGHARRRLHTLTKLDWRDRGIITPVRAQGSCGSCWLMAGTHALEAAYMISENITDPVQLSPQQVLDCFDVGTCYYGSSAEMFNAVTQHSLTLESVYPLTSDRTGTPGVCKKSLLKSLPAGESIQLSAGAGYERLEAQGERRLIWATQFNPVVMHYEVDLPFMNYAGGVYTAQQCTGEYLNHALVSYGYNMDAGWWLFKNSWGPHWGDDGYVRIKMIGGSGTCGLYRWAVRPSLDFVQTLSGGNGGEAARKPKLARSRAHLRKA